jgi:hypothetical protein
VGEAAEQQRCHHRAEWGGAGDEHIHEQVKGIRCIASLHLAGEV